MPGPAGWWGRERRFILLLGAAVASTAAVGAVVLLRPRTPLAQTVGDLAILSGCLLALVGCLSASRRGGPAARGWRGLACAMALWSAGQLSWTFSGITRAHSHPFPSLADVGYLGYSVPLVLALVLFPRSSERPVVRTRVLLDGLLTAAHGVLSKLGFTVELVGDGRQALAALDEPRPTTSC